MLQIRTVVRTATHSFRSSADSATCSLPPRGAGPFEESLFYTGNFLLLMSDLHSEGGGPRGVFFPVV